MTLHLEPVTGRLHLEALLRRHIEDELEAARSEQDADALLWLEVVWAAVRNALTLRLRRAARDVVYAHDIGACMGARGDRMDYLSRVLEALEAADG